MIALALLAASLTVLPGDASAADPASTPTEQSPAQVVVAAAAVPAANLPTSPSSAITASAVTSSAAFEPTVAPAMEPVAAPVQKRQATLTQRRAWMAVSIAQHSAATFDAWTTRRAMAMGGFRETNPLLRPFAGNASMYAAVQVTPLALDWVGARMQRSDNKWVRRLWWVPQTVQTGIHIQAGVKNLRVASGQ